MKHFLANISKENKYAELKVANPTKVRDIRKNFPSIIVNQLAEISFSFISLEISISCLIKIKNTRISKSWMHASSRILEYDVGYFFSARSDKFSKVPL